MEMKEECKFLKDCQCDCTGADDKVEVCEVYRLREENAELKADLKSLEYTVALQGKRDIDNAVDLFAKHIAKIESENSILKAENAELKENDCEQCKHLDLYIKYKQTLQEIKKIVTEPCIDGENCNTCKSNCTNKDILDLITKAEVGNE